MFSSIHNNIYIANVFSAQMSLRYVNTCLLLLIHFRNICKGRSPLVVPEEDCPLQECQCPKLPRQVRSPAAAWFIVLNTLCSSNTCLKCVMSFMFLSFLSGIRQTNLRHLFHFSSTVRKDQKKYIVIITSLPERLTVKQLHTLF